MGIENIKEVLKFMCELVNGVVKSLEDDHFNFADAINFYGAAKAIPAMIKDIDQVPGELMDLTDEEQQELIEYVKTEFDIPEDKVEKFVESAFRAMIYMVDAIKAGMNAFKKEA